MRFLRRSQRDVELEMRAHIDLETDRLIEEGHDPGTARDLARRAFGNMSSAQERYYDSNLLAWWSDARTDVRYAWRRLRRHPAFAASVIAITALGVAACVATFSLVSGILLAPLPFPRPDHVFALEMHARDLESAAVPTSIFLDLQRNNPVVEAIGAGEPTRGTLRVDGELLRLPAVRVTPSFFRVYRLVPALGRFFDDRDVDADAPVVMLGYEEWRSRFAGDSAIVGRTLTVNDRPHVVVGVMPPRFLDHSQSQHALWLPMRVKSTADAASVNAVLRVPDSVDATRASAILASVTGRIEDFATGDSLTARAALVPIAELVSGNVRQPLLILLAAVLLVLTLVAANVATMFLAQSIARSGEMTVRRALGAGRGRQLRQLITESLTVTAIGGALGVAASVILVDVVRRLGTRVLPRIEDVSIDWRVSVFAVAAIVITGLAGGLAQVFATRRDPSVITAGTSARVSSPKASTSLVVVQVALSTTLLIGAGLLVKGFLKVAPDRPGFAVHNRAAILVDLNARDRTGRDDPELARRRIAAIRDRLASESGVDGVGVTTFLPLTGMVSITDVSLPGARGGARQPAYQNLVDAAYFATMQMTIRRGRGITAEDRAGGAPVVVISETAARTWFGAGDAIGQVITVGRGGNRAMLTVVGVVNDTRLSGRSTRPRAQLYLPFDQRPIATRATFAVATRGPAADYLPRLRRAISAADRDVVIESATDMEAIVAESVGRSRFFSVAMGLFAGASVVLSALGVYGLLAFTVSQRRREIGIRKALGASEARIGTAVTTRAGMLGGSGMVVGLAVAYALSRFMESLLTEVAARDAAVFAGAATATLVMSLLAGVIPAYTAVRVDPNAAIRGHID
jgi:predicted permease